MPFVGQGMLIFLRESAWVNMRLHHVHLLSKPSSSTAMLMVAIIACRIEISVFVYVYRDIKDIRILIECLLNAVAY